MQVVGAALPGHGFRFPRARKGQPLAKCRYCFDFTGLCLPHASVSSCRVPGREGCDTRVEHFRRARVHRVPSCVVVVSSVRSKVVCCFFSHPCFLDTSCVPEGFFLVFVSISVSFGGLFGGFVILQPCFVFVQFCFPVVPTHGDETTDTWQTHLNSGRVSVAIAAQRLTRRAPRRPRASPQVPAPCAQLAASPRSPSPAAACLPLASGPPVLAEARVLRVRRASRLRRRMPAPGSRCLEPCARRHVLTTAPSMGMFGQAASSEKGR